MSQVQRAGVSLAVCLSHRQLCSTQVKQQPWLQDFSCEGQLAGTVLVHPNGVGTPPFAVEYSQVLQNRKYLAVADEEGYVSVLDTSAPLPRGLHDEGSTPAQWLAHHNAIFDVAWCKDDKHILTASGDQTLALWDTSRAACLGVFKGHHGSVKCVRPKPDCPDVFASGARDGALMVWDSREAAQWDGDRQTGIYSPVMIMEDAHKYVSTESARKRRKQVESKQSVTSAVFLHEGQVLASAGAGDGKVKFWDLRKTDKPSWQLAAPSPGATPQVITPTPRTKTKVQPFLEVPSVSKSQHPHGITCLAQDPLGSRLLVSVGNNVHYLYDTLRPHIGPTAAFTGHAASSFFIKACFSPDGTHILSGSSDKNAYIWQVDKPYAKPYVLRGHDREVTAVAWCPTDSHSIATCGDDDTVKLWSVQRPWPPVPRHAPLEEEEKENAMGLATTNWLQSPAPSTPAASPHPHPTPAPGPLTENPAVVAAAANRENVSAHDHTAGCSPAIGQGPRAIPGSALKGAGARYAQLGTPFTPHSQPQAADLLSNVASASAVTTTSRRQRSICDFFVSPPVLPSAKRLKTEAHASSCEQAAPAQTSGKHGSASHHLVVLAPATHELAAESSTKHDSAALSSARPGSAEQVTTQQVSAKQEVSCQAAMTTSQPCSAVKQQSTVLSQLQHAHNNLSESTQRDIGSRLLQGIAMSPLGTTCWPSPSADASTQSSGW